MNDIPKLKLCDSGVISIRNISIFLDGIIDEIKIIANATFSQTLINGIKILVQMEEDDYRIVFLTPFGTIYSFAFNKFL